MSESKVDAGAQHDGQLVDPFERYAVEIEDVVAVVDIGHAHVEVQDAAASDGEAALHAQVHAVVVGHPAAVEFAVVGSEAAVGVPVVADDAVAEGDILVYSQRLRVGKSAAEAPASAQFPLLLVAQRVGGQQVHRVAAVVVGRVGLHGTRALHVAERVGAPYIESLHVIAQRHVHARGVALLEDEIGHIVLRLLVDGARLVGRVRLVVHLVVVHVEQLAEILQIALHVGAQMLRDVVFHAGHQVLGALHAVHRVAEEGAGLVQLSRTGEEAAEQVDDVVVRAGIEDNLAVQSAGQLDAQPVGGVPLGCQARFHARLAERYVVHQPYARVDNPVARLDVVGCVGRDVGCVFVLFLRDAVGVRVVVFRGVALHADAAFQLVLAEEVGHVDGGVEAADAAVLVLLAVVVQPHQIVGIGHGAVEDGRGARHEHEVASHAVVAPVVVGDGLVAQHLVVETETEQVEFASRTGVERQLAVQVQEVERQSSVDIGIHRRGGLGEVGVLGCQQVGDGCRVVGRLPFQRSFGYQSCAESVEG